MHLVNVLSSASWGGLEMYACKWMHLMLARGHSVTAIVQEGTPVARSLADSGVTVLKVPSESHINLRAINAIVASAREPRSVIVSHSRVDVWSASVAARMSGVPLVNHVYMVAVPKHDILHSLIYSRVDATVCSSQVNLEAIQRFYPIRASTTHLIRYLRSETEYSRNLTQREAWRRAWSAHHDTLVLGMTTRIDPLKRIRLAVESLDFLPSKVLRRIRLVIVGSPTVSATARDGSTSYEADSKAEYDWLLRQCSLPNRIGTLFYVPFQPSTVGVLSAFDAFLMLTRGEMYALSVVEAMLCGLPIIGVQSGGTSEQVGTDRGILLNSESASEVADTIAYYLDNPSVRERHGFNAFHWAQTQHSPETVLSQWESLFEALLQRRLS